ncbi:MAG: nucleotidyltransferase [Nitrospirota bacterium]
MAIPESQLETWANPGATVTAKATHESIRNALESQSSPIANRIKNGTVEIYLQGSYKNDTNIRGDSDVDVIVELSTTFHHNSQELPLEQRQSHIDAYITAQYNLTEFRNDIVTALKKYYEDKFVDASGGKSIKLLPAAGRLKADIVPATKFRKYSYFNGSDSFSAARGIWLYDFKAKSEIINFPHHHYNNGVAKNSEKRTNGFYKPTVRIFKNARSYLVDNNQLTKESAPSYFLQSLIYNMPDELFGIDYQSTVYNILTFLHKYQILNFMCQNEQHLLFGNSPEQWNLSAARNTIDKLIALWNNW